jgi:hypothetical protein
VRKAFVEALKKEFDGWGLKFSIGGQARAGRCFFLFLLDAIN